MVFSSHLFVYYFLPLALLVYYLASVVGLPIWMRLSMHIGKHRAFIVSIVWFSIWASMIPFIPAGWFSVFLVIMVFSDEAVQNRIVHTQRDMQENELGIVRLAQGRSESYGF